MVTIVAAGTCTISADQGGNGTYNPAPQVLASFTVNPASGGGAVTRLAGADRYETAVEISKALNPDPGAGIDTAYIATGANFPDALGGGPLAASKHGPILLVPGTSIPAVVTAELTRLHPTNIVILGGTGVVSSGVETDLGTYGAVTRLAGADRYETAVAISQALNPGQVPLTSTRPTSRPARTSPTPSAADRSRPASTARSCSSRAPASRPS